MAFLEDKANAQMQQARDKVIVFLYVYPTLLARLGALVEGLVARLGENVECCCVTLTYHFEHELAGLQRRRLGEENGRFEVHGTRS